MSKNLQATLLAEKDLPLLNLVPKNELLAQLIAADNLNGDALLYHLRPVSLERNQVLYEQGDSIEFIYFPLDCVVSSLAIMEDGTTIETSLVGREGLVGISAILGSGKARQWVWVSVSGTALQLEARFLNPLFLHNEDALKALLRFYRSTITQVSQRCVCNTRHTVLERLCCWLLMIHDRVGGGNLRLTQEMIASRLGARRAGVTVAAGVLQEMHAIEYRRGQIHIIDCGALEQAACECYAIMHRELNLHPQGSGLSLVYRCK